MFVEKEPVVQCSRVLYVRLWKVVTVPYCIDDLEFKQARGVRFVDVDEVVSK